MSDNLADLQLAAVLAPGLTRGDLQLASRTAIDGSALFVAANRRRTSIWVEGSGRDGVRRHFQLVVHRIGPRPSYEHFPGVIAKWSAYEAGHRIFRFAISFAARQRQLAITAAVFRADGGTATKYLHLICDGSRSLTEGTIRMHGHQHGTRLDERLEATIDLNVPRFRDVKSPFSRWMEATFPVELPRIQHFQPLMEYAAARYQLRWNRLLGLRGLSLNSPPKEIFIAEDLLASNSPDMCFPSGPFVAGCCDYQPTYASAVLCYIATAEAAIIDPLVANFPTQSGPDSGNDDSGNDAAGDGNDEGGDDDPGSGVGSGDGDGSFNGGGCFVRGTPVGTPEGLRPIEAVVPGTEVWAYDIGTGTTSARKVERVFHQTEPTIMTMEFDGVVLRCTPAHRFYADEWRPACSLSIGDRILCRDGTYRTLRNMAQAGEPQPVFNLRVEGLHNYFVGSAGLLVHNEKDSRVVTGDDPGWPDDVD